ncbi:hypothetical protein HRbin12_01216 [bacterium HR12]|nr:hypothetical protein HRbin12_01216 [bacterium HR12]
MSPIATLRPRYREVGRLRLGEAVAGPGGRSRPQALETWRLTSPYADPIAAAARLWGGTVAEHDGVYDLVTEVSSLPVLVPDQDPLEAQWLEEWSAGGLVRRCDGIAQVSGEPCLRDEDPPGCRCQPTTHLLVVLPDLPDLGVWRLTTRGWAAASELPQAVRLVLHLAGRGRMPRAELAIERRSRRTSGETQRFVVPVLRVPVALSELAEGSARAALPAGVDPETGEILPDSSTASEVSGPSAAVAPPGAAQLAAAADPTSPPRRPGPAAAGDASPSDDEGLWEDPWEPEAEADGEGAEASGSRSRDCLHLAGTRTVVGARGQRVEVCVSCSRPVEVTR